MEIYEKEALLRLFYTDEYREKSKETNGELYDRLVQQLKEEWEDNKKVFKDDKTAFISEYADSHTEVYTTEIFKWYSEDCRLFTWADDAYNEFGWNSEKGIVGLLMSGIYMFLESFANEILEELEE